ncbi:MAG: DUF1232 domain-containing protein [Bacteroidota bacterium]|nr:DUF1232 domain-containing protein [Bacteroidota bacterium]
MLFLLRWYLYSRFPKYRRAYRLVFDPEGFHHYPKELKSQVEIQSPEEICHSLESTLATYRNASGTPRLHETYEAIAAIIVQLPAILEIIIDMVNTRSLSLAEKKRLIAIVAYLVCPVDVIPEGALGGVGFADDAICVGIAANLFLSEGKGRVSLWDSHELLLEKLRLLNELSRENLPELYSEVRTAYLGIFA